MLRIASHELEDTITHALGALHSNKFVLSIYFGKNMAVRYERLASRCSTSSRPRCFGPSSAATRTGGT